MSDLILLVLFLLKQIRSRIHETKRRVQFSGLSGTIPGIQGLTIRLLGKTRQKRSMKRLRIRMKAVNKTKFLDLSNGATHFNH
jgi:hypothetical protein